MDNQSRSTKHVVIVMGLFFVGLAFRLIRLDVLPLTNLEAAHALQALAISNGEQTLFEGVHAYVGLTGLPFYLFSSSNFVARFWAAILGALIVFIPMLSIERAVRPFTRYVPKQATSIIESAQVVVYKYDRGSKFKVCASLECAQLFATS